MTAAADGACVLIVDDNVELLELMATALPRISAFSVVTCEDGASALQRYYALNPRPVCVVIDVVMPEMNGYQLVRALRGDATSAATPLIILTAMAQDRDSISVLAIRPKTSSGISIAVGTVVRVYSSTNSTFYSASLTLDDDTGQRHIYMLANPISVNGKQVTCYPLLLTGQGPQGPQCSGASLGLAPKTRVAVLYWDWSSVVTPGARGTDEILTLR